jgi:hypothetical protein
MTSKIKVFSRLITTSTVFGIASLGMISTVNAAILKIDESAFNAQSGLITFSEKASGTNNPVYTASEYGGGIGRVSASQKLLTTREQLWGWRRRRLAK